LTAVALASAFTAARWGIAADGPIDAKRASFHRLLDRPHGALRPESASETGDGFVVEHGSFFSEEKERVPFLALRKEGAAGRLPAVVVLHGTGGTKEAMRPTLEDLARRGYLALAIDARFHGERAGGAPGKQAYQDAILRAWRERDPHAQAHPFFYDTVYDLWRTLDYLATRPDVDAERIGMIGFSMGGIETWLAAATDPRIRVAVPAIGVQSFRWSLEHDEWQGRARTIQQVHDEVARELGEPAVNAKVCRALWEKIVPGILDEYDGPAMLPLIAPRPMLILSGEKDPNCPLAGARLAYAAAETAYARTGAADHLKMDIAAGIGHAVTPEQRRLALDWFDRWLQGKTR
jgi:dienelactone hydrolase